MAIIKAIFSYSTFTFRILIESILAFVTFHIGEIFLARTNSSFVITTLINWALYTTSTFWKKTSIEMITMNFKNNFEFSWWILGTLFWIFFHYELDCCSRKKNLKSNKITPWKNHVTKRLHIFSLFSIVFRNPNPCIGIQRV